MKSTFTLTEDHIKLLTNSYVSWSDGNNIYGAACIDSKRPYGNTGIIEDIYELIEGKILDENELIEQGIDYEEFVNELYIKYKTLHRETETALQIVLHTKSFEVGEYRIEGYGKDWVKVD